MVLSKNEIKTFCVNNKLIFPCLQENIQTSSYDLTLGDEYYLCNNDNDNVVKIGKEESLIIPEDAICYIISEEILQIPNNITAIISLDFSLIKAGVVLSNQPPIDAGYNGKIVALLHNLSNIEVTIKRGKHVLNIMFYKLSSNLCEEDLYSGKYQNLSSLTDYCKDVKPGGVQTLKTRFEEELEKNSKMRKDYDKQKMKFERFLPTFIIVLSILITLLTIIFGILGIKTYFD